MSFKKINCDDITVGVRFSAPVFFEDGTNMFLAEGRSAKPYHIAALKRWNIPHLFSYGHIISDSELDGVNKVGDEELEELETLEAD